MRLIDLLTTGKQTKTIPKAEIPSLLGEIEALKARLWVRLTEWEGLDSVVVFAKAARDQTQAVEKPAKNESHDRMSGPEGRILRAKDVMRMIGLSRSTIWRLENKGKFPKRANIGGKTVGWRDKEIHEWIDSRFKKEE